MALTLGITPATFNFSKSPVIARIVTNKLVVTTGVYASATINFSGTGAAVGQSILFFINGTGFAMTFDTALDDSGQKLRTNTTSLSVAGFVQQVAEDLLTNYYLQENFTITTNPTWLTLTAKEKGAEWTIAAVTLATGMSVSTSTTGVDQVLNENFRLRVDLFVEMQYLSNNYTKITNTELEPFNGSADFELQELLHACFTDCDIPFWQQAVLTRCRHNLKRYYIVYSEKYGAVPASKRAYKSDIFHIYRGGISKQEFPTVHPALQAWIWPQKKFLTWSPNDKDVTLGGQEYLYFSVPTGCTGYDVQLLITYSDGTTTQVTKYTRAVAAEFEIYCIPTGYTQAGIGDYDPLKEVVSYEFWVRSSDIGNPDLTEHRRYYPVYRRQYEFRQFMYNNSLGGNEILTVTGEIVRGIQTEDLVAQRRLTNEYEVTDGDMFKVYAEKNDTFKVSVGHISKAQADALDELFLAEKQYVADEAKQRWLPIVFNKATIDKYKTSDDLFTINFEYTLAYTNRVIEGDITEAPTTTMSISTATTTATLVTFSGGPISITSSTE